MPQSKPHDSTYAFVLENLMYLSVLLICKYYKLYDVKCQGFMKEVFK